MYLLLLVQYYNRDNKSKTSMGHQEDNARIWKEIALKCKNISSYLIPAFIEFSKCGNKSRKSLTLMNLMRRVECNLKSVYVLSILSLKRDCVLYYKFPVGLLVRSCLMDCITGMYILKNGDKRCDDIINLWNRGYVKALFEEFEVYKDKISFSFSDEFLEHIYTSALEDTFVNYMDLNEKVDKIEPMKERFMWKACDPKKIYPEYRKTDGLLKSMKDELSNDDTLGRYINCIYAYYKYFSQYEHYSELGHGDSLVNFGDDNIRFEKVFDYIECIVQLIVGNVSLDKE